MKVLHVIPGVSPLHGGPSEALRHMTTVLARSGIQVEVATTTSGDDEGADIPANEPVDVNGILHHCFPRQWPKSWSFSRLLFRFLRLKASRYDIFHVHSVFNFPSCAAAKAAGKSGIPFVVRPCGMLDVWPLRQKAWRKLIYYNVLEKRNLSGAVAIHCTSQSEAENVRRLGYGEKIHVIPLSVPIPPPIERRRGTSEPLKVLFLSRIHKIKGLPVLFEALAILQEEGIPFVTRVAGEGTADYLTRMRKKVDTLRLTERVQFIGFVRGKEREREFEQADIFVLPSYHENMGLAVTEAMSSGLPVVITDQVALAQEIREAEAGVVVPVDSPQALARAIRFYGDERNRFRSGSNARRLVQEQFHDEKMASSLIALYGSIIEKTHRRIDS